MQEIGIQISADVSGSESIDELANDLDGLAKIATGELQAGFKATAARLRELGEQDKTISAFTTLQGKVSASEKALNAAALEAKNYAAQISKAGPPTVQEAAALQRLEAAALGARVEFTQQNLALSTAQAALQRYGIAGQNAREAQTRLRAEIEQVSQSVAEIAPGYQRAAAGAQTAGASMVRTHRQIGDGVESISAQLSRMQGFVAGLAGLQGFKAMASDLAKTADQVNNLQARLKLVTGEGDAFATAWAGVTGVALRTNSALEETGTLFTRLAQAGKDAGQSNTDAVAGALALTETINQSIQLSGASAEASSAAITQLVQGLQSGVLRGDEFNSIMEQAPRLAKALANGLNVTTGELRKMAEAGLLTSETVTNALKGQSDAIASEFSKLPPTVGRALQNLSTNWTLYVGETDKATGASQAAASAIGALANNLSGIANLLLDAGQAAAAFAAVRLAQHFAGIAAAATQSATAVLANTAAVTAAGNAGASAAVNVGRFASILGSLKLFSLLGIVTNFKDIGTWIGEATAKLAGYKDQTKELIRAEKASVEIAADNVAMRQRMAQATQDAIDKQFELSKSAKTAIAEFDKLTKAGDTSAEAIAKIGKDFDLSKSQGIRDAASVFDKLAASGKISAAEVQQGWAKALDGKDLATFEVMAKVAFSGAKREAELLAQVAGPVLQEAIKRSGLDLEVISGGIGKAARSAINDTDTIIQNLDKLKAQGIDTGLVLAASIGKGINTADSQKAIEALRAQIESLRSKLGDKITDGLLDQTKQKANEIKDGLDKAIPGINGVREAMIKLGVTSDESLKKTAKEAKEAYEAMVSDGTRSARELAAGFKDAADKAIAANNGIAPSWVQAGAAARGYTIEVDAAGKAMLKAGNDGTKAMQENKAAIDDAAAAARYLAESYERFILQQTLSSDLTSRQIDLLEKEAALVERREALERKRQNVDKDGFSTNKDGNRTVMGGDLNTLTGIAAFLKTAGVADDATARKIALEFSDGKGDIPYLNNPGQRAYGGDTLSMALLKAAEKYTFGTGGGAGPGFGSGGSGSAPLPKTIPDSGTTVNINLNGSTQSVKTDAAGARVLQEVLSQLANAKGTSSAR